MRGLFVLAALALAAGLPAQSGHADTKVVAKAGSWEAFAGTTRGDKIGVCGISATVGDRYFGLKQFAGERTFTIQMSDKSWQLKIDQDVALTLQFDVSLTWRANGTAFRFDDGDPGIQLDVGRTELDRFRREFRDSSLLRIRFGDLLPEWQLGLQGTGAMNGPLEDCIRNLK